jgi:hypothetical protein
MQQGALLVLGVGLLRCLEVGLLLILLFCRFICGWGAGYCAVQHQASSVAASTESGQKCALSVTAVVLEIRVIRVNSTHSNVDPSVVIMDSAPLHCICSYKRACVACHL